MINIWETEAYFPTSVAQYIYKYLVYSKVQDGAYCLPHVLFSGGSDRCALSQTLFKDWKDAVAKFESHFHARPVQAVWPVQLWPNQYFAYPY